MLCISLAKFRNTPIFKYCLFVLINNLIRNISIILHVSENYKMMEASRLNIIKIIYIYMPTDILTYINKLIYTSMLRILFSKN